jgi:hypothetical protein
MLKKLIAPVVLSSALLGSLIVGGVAYAAAPTSGPTATAAATAAHQTAAHRTDKGKLRAWLKAHRKAIRAKVVAISASTIGVTPQTLVAELKTGKSIAQVATEHHVDPSTVVTALSVAADAKVAQAVAQHELTRAQADRIDAILPARITRIVDRVR